MLPLNRNPLVYRSVRQVFRPGRFLFGLIATIATLVVAFAYVYIAIRENGYPYSVDWTKFCRWYACFCLAVEVFLAFFGAVGFMLDSLVTERNRNTYEFFESLPISPTDKVIGLCVGSTLPILLIGGLLGVLGFLFGAAGGISAANLLWLQILIVAGYAASALFGLLGSVYLGRTRLAWLGVLLLFLFSLHGIAACEDRSFTAVPFLITSPHAIFQLSVMEPGSWPTLLAEGNYHFYSLRVPWQVCPLVFYVYLVTAFFLMARRGLSRPTGAPGSRSLVVASAAVLHGLLIGFFADYFRTSNRGDALGGLLAYLVGFYVMTAVWGMGAAPYRGALMQWVQRRRPAWPIRTFTHSLWEKDSPSVFPVALLWILTAVAGAIIAFWFLPWLRVTGLIVLAGLLLPFLLAYILLFQTGAMLTQRGGKLVGFVLVLVVILVPTAFSMIDSTEDCLYATPFGAILRYVHAVDVNHCGSGYGIEEEWNDDGVAVTKPRPPIWITGYTPTLVIGVLLLLAATGIWLGMTQSLWRLSPSGRKALGYS